MYLLLLLYELFFKYIQTYLQNQFYLKIVRLSIYALQ